MTLRGNAADEPRINTLQLNLKSEMASIRDVLKSCCACDALKVCHVLTLPCSSSSPLSSSSACAGTSRSVGARARRMRSWTAGAASSSSTTGLAFFLLRSHFRCFPFYVFYSSKSATPQQGVPAHSLCLCGVQRCHHGGVPQRPRERPVRVPEVPHQGFRRNFGTSDSCGAVLCWVGTGLVIFCELYL